MLPLPKTAFMALTLLGCWLPTPVAQARDPRAEALPEDADLLTSCTTIASAKSAPDTFWLYGGPGSSEGKFGTISAPDPQGWTGRDHSDVGPIWQRSTFLADSFSQGAGNHILWAGFSEAQRSHWATAPGYGNNWNGSVSYTREVSDPSVGQTVSLNFLYRHDLEPGYDFFLVEYERAAAAVNVLTRSGNSGAVLAFPAETPSALPIVYAGNDYANGNQIVLRMRVTSDYAWSDEDGYYPSDGAVQLDQIVVTTSEGTDAEDFEAESGWKWQIAPTAFMGDFAKLFSNLSDPDPCRDNLTPQWTFIDDGSSPRNAPGQTTGGTLAAFPYSAPFGVPGGYGVNGSGGLLRTPFTPLRNDVVSPPIAWNHPSAGDDGPNVRCYVAYTVMEWWYTNSPGHSFGLEYSQDGKIWRRAYESSFVFYAATTLGYYEFHRDISPYLPAWPESPAWIRVFFQPMDAAGHIGSTPRSPAPFFDNVRVYKVPAGNALLLIESWNLLDAMPRHHPWDLSTPSARDLLDVRLDSTPISPWRGADSLVVGVNAIDPGATLVAADTKLVWVLDKNPLFEDLLRTPPPATTTVSGGAANGWDQWVGEIPGRFVNPLSIGSAYCYFDLPDADFFYPSDVLRYHFVSVNPHGFISTLPADLSGFEQGHRWPENFTARALPSMLDAAGGTPPVLLISYGLPEWGAEWLQSLDELGWQVGVDYDLFTQPNSSPSTPLFLASSGIDPTNPTELAGYTGIIAHYRHDVFFYYLERTHEFELLANWRQLPGNRTNLQFLNSCGSQMRSGSALASQLSVVYNSGNADNLLGVRSPLAVAISPATTNFVVARPCARYNWPWIERYTPLGNAVGMHFFEDPPGSGIPRADFPATIVHDRLDAEGDRIRDVTVPFDLSHVRDLPAKYEVIGARTRLLSELLGPNVPHNPPVSTQTPRAAHIALRATPNPFNARTQIVLELAEAQQVELTIFDVAGRRLRVLLAGELAAGRNEVGWDGHDARGHALASGVYFVRLRAVKQQQTLKLALVE